MDVPADRQYVRRLFLWVRGWKGEWIDEQRGALQTAQPDRIGTANTNRGVPSPVSPPATVSEMVSPRGTSGGVLLTLLTSWPFFLGSVRELASRRLVGWFDPMHEPLSTEAA